MNSLTQYIVLIEKRRLLRAAVSALTSLGLILPGVGLRVAHAAPAAVQGQGHAVKVAKDLDDEVRNFSRERPKWSRDIGGVRHVQAILVSNSADPAMADLRAAVLKLGGSVHAVHTAARSMTVQIKASDLTALSQRDDVVAVSPNRQTQRTFSTLEATTGATSAGVRTYSSKTAYTGLDGGGVGIAILDSGVMRNHKAFSGPAGVRVKRNVTMLNNSLANWTTGAAGVSSLQPGSTALASYEAAIKNDTAVTQDGYGHGTHVAGVAAGRYFAPKAPTNRT